MAVAIVIPFVLTFIVGKAKLSPADRLGEDYGEESRAVEEAQAAQVPAEEKMEAAENLLQN